jgi:hypothetical protein
MPGTATKVKMGAAWVTYKGSDLGYTKGGISISFNQQAKPIVIDSLGTNPLAQVVMSRVAAIRVPLAESTASRITTLIPTSTTIGTDILASSGALVITPKVGGGAITFDRAIPTGTMQVAYAFDRERVWMVEFEAYMNTGDHELFSLEDVS